MKAVVQQERTGCAIASVAALAGITYPQAKTAAAQLGITAADPALWRETVYIRALLAHFGLCARAKEEPFTSWEKLPNQALLSIKWHIEADGPAWHWVVFVREPSGPCVLDPKKSLQTHRRTDFSRMHPKWFIEIQPVAPR